MFNDVVNIWRRGIPGNQKKPRGGISANIRRKLYKGLAVSVLLKGGGATGDYFKIKS